MARIDAVRRPPIAQPWLASAARGRAALSWAFPIVRWLRAEKESGHQVRWEPGGRDTERLRAPLRVRLLGAAQFGYAQIGGCLVTAGGRRKRTTGWNEPDLDPAELCPLVVGGDVLSAARVNRCCRGAAEVRLEVGRTLIVAGGANQDLRGSELQADAGSTSDNGSGVERALQIQILELRLFLVGVADENNLARGILIQVRLQLFEQQTLAAIVDARAGPCEGQIGAPLDRRIAAPDGDGGGGRSASPLGVGSGGGNRNFLLLLAAGRIEPHRGGIVDVAVHSAFGSGETRRPDGIAAQAAEIRAQSG